MRPLPLSTWLQDHRAPARLRGAATAARAVRRPRPPYFRLSVSTRQTPPRTARQAVEPQSGVCPNSALGSPPLPPRNAGRFWNRRRRARRARLRTSRVAPSTGIGAHLQSLRRSHSNQPSRHPLPRTTLRGSARIAERAAQRRLPKSCSSAFLPTDNHQTEIAGTISEQPKVGPKGEAHDGPSIPRSVIARQKSRARLLNRRGVRRTAPNDSARMHWLGRSEAGTAKRSDP